jgi:hypothetical protein
MSPGVACLAYEGCKPGNTRASPVTLRLGGPAEAAVVERVYLPV